MSGLLSLLEENAALLSERVYTEMIEDPFWLERYGERAAVHMRQDSVFHLQYLREAIDTAHPEVMENYARWLQTLLTARGMCTLHIAENFDRLRKAIAAQQWGVDLQLVGTLLEAATTALRYPPGPASNLQALPRVARGRSSRELPRGCGLCRGPGALRGPRHLVARLPRTARPRRCRCAARSARPHHRRYPRGGARDRRRARYSTRVNSAVCSPVYTASPSCEIANR